MKKERKDNQFIKKPVYPGGDKALKAFISHHKQYPKAALEHKIEGTVSIRYTINYVGSVIKVKILAGLGHGCDEEAARIVKLLKFKVPRTRKVRVQFQKSIHIHFKLPKKVEQSTKIVFTASKKKEVKDSKPNTGRSYHYKIEW
jgi:protein TonB